MIMSTPHDATNNLLAEIAFALGYSKWPLLRRVALSVATRQMWELHEHGNFQRGTEYLNKLCCRFKLGDYREAARQHLNNI